MVSRVCVFLVLWSSIPPPLFADSCCGRVLSRLCFLLCGQQGAAPFWRRIETSDKHPVRRIFTLAFHGGFTWWERPLWKCIYWLGSCRSPNVSFCGGIEASSVSSCIHLEGFIPTALPSFPVLNVPVLHRHEPRGTSQFSKTVFMCFPCVFANPAEDERRDTRKEGDTF